MFIGPDFERQLRLQRVERDLTEKFEMARMHQDASFRALTRVAFSRTPVSPQIMKQAERALILRAATDRVSDVCASLLDCGEELAANPQNEGIIRTYDKFEVDPETVSNPSFMRYPGHIKRGLSIASRIALTAILAEIEEWDPGLAQLAVLSERSMKNIQTRNVLMHTGAAYLFNTKIPGLSVSYQYPTPEIPVVSFVMHQLNTQKSLIS